MVGGLQEWNAVPWHDHDTLMRNITIIQVRAALSNQRPFHQATCLCAIARLITGDPHHPTQPYRTLVQLFVTISVNSLGKVQHVTSGNQPSFAYFQSCLHYNMHQKADSCGITSFPYQSGKHVFSVWPGQSTSSRQKLSRRASASG